MIKRITQLIKENFVFIKFGISGSSALVSDLFFLYIFHAILEIPLVFSVYLAYSISFFVSFVLQKFWTFRNKEKNRAHKQFLMYVVVGVTGLNLNTYFVHLLVSKYSVFYLIAQFVVAVLLGMVNFLVYRFIIFKEKKYWIRDMKNVLIATSFFPPDKGANANYAEILCRDLPQNGYNLRVVTYSDLEPRACKKKKYEGYVLYKISRKQTLWWSYFLYFKKIWRHLYWADFVYILGTVNEGVPACLACKLRRRKYVLRVTGDYTWEQGRDRFNITDNLNDFQSKNYVFEVEFLRYLQKFVARRAEAIIAPREELKKNILSWGVDANKVKIFNCDYNKEKNDIQERAKALKEIVLIIKSLTSKSTVSKS